MNDYIESIKKIISPSSEDIKILKYNDDKIVIRAIEDNQTVYYKFYNSMIYDCHSFYYLQKLLGKANIAFPYSFKVASLSRGFLFKEEEAQGNILFLLSPNTDFRLIATSLGKKLGALDLIKIKDVDNCIPLYQNKNKTACQILTDSYAQFDFNLLYESKIDYTHLEHSRRIIADALSVDEYITLTHNDINIWHLFFNESECSGIIDFDMASRGLICSNLAQSIFTLINTRFEFMIESVLKGYSYSNHINDFISELIISYIHAYSLWKINNSLKHRKMDAFDFYYQKYKRFIFLLQNNSFSI